MTKNAFPLEDKTFLDFFNEEVVFLRVQLPYLPSFILEITLPLSSATGWVLTSSTFIKLCYRSTELLRVCPPFTSVERWKVSTATTPDRQLQDVLEWWVKTQVNCPYSSQVFMGMQLQCTMWFQPRSGRPNLHQLSRKNSRLGSKSILKFRWTWHTLMTSKYCTISSCKKSCIA